MKPDAPRPEDMTDDAAAEIYQEFLDFGGACIIEGKTAVFARRVSLPFVLRTATSETLIESTEEVEKDAIQVTEWLRGLSATHYMRLVKKARFLNDHMIEGWHTTHALRNAMNLTPPYNSRLVMRLEDGVWKVVEAEHELANKHFPVNLVRSAPGTFAERWAQPMADIRTTHTDAKPIYDAFLSVLGASEEARDVKAWLTLFRIPYDVHYDTYDHIVTHPDQARPFFSLLMEKLTNTGAKGLTRTTQSAQFIAADQVVGYHDTSIFKDGEEVFGPVRSRMIICLTNGSWQCRSVTNSLSNQAFPGAEFVSSNVLPTAREIQERMRK